MSDQDLEARMREKARDACPLGSVRSGTLQHERGKDCSWCERIFQALLDVARERDAELAQVRTDLERVEKENAEMRQVLKG